MDGDALTGVPAAAPTPAHIPANRVFAYDAYAHSSDVDIDYARTVKRKNEGRPGIFWTPAHDGHWVAASADVIERVLGEPENFSARLVVVPRERNMDPPLLPVQADPPDWMNYRIFFNKALSPKAVQSLTATARNLAVQLIEGFKAKGRCDFIEEFSYHLPIAIFMQIAGLPAEDRSHLLQLVHRVMRPITEEDRMGAQMGLGAYSVEKIRERRANPGEDAISDMANGLVDGQPISEHTLTGMVTLMLMAGLDTVAGMMGFFMWHLAQNPEQRHFLRAHPDRIPDAVDELLRRFSITTQGRVAARDVEIDGVTVKRGEQVVICTPLHGLDDSRYPNSLEVDFDRKPRTHYTFGGGVHRCAGANLARAELRVLLEEWLPRIPDFELDPNGKTVMGCHAVASLLSLPLVWKP